MEYSANVKKQLREWSTEAYRREMARELKKLEKDIASWKQGRLSSEELSHRIHAFDTGPSKALSQQYDYGQVDANVAFALVAGILKSNELPEHLLQAIEPTIQTYRDLKASGKLDDRKGKWWST